MKHVLVIRSFRGAIALWRFLCIDLVLVSVVLALVIYLLRDHLGVYLPRTIVPFVNAGVLLTLLHYGVWVLVSTWRCTRHSHVAVRWLTRTGLLATPFLLAHFLSTLGHVLPTARAQITDGYTLVVAHRAAIYDDCADGTMKRRTVKQFHEHHSLPAPGLEQKAAFYSVVGTVSARTDSDHEATVTMVFRRRIYDSAWPVETVAVEKGMTLVYEATCSEGVVNWWVSGGTVPERYRPQFLRPSRSPEKGRR